MHSNAGRCKCRIDKIDCFGWFIEDIYFIDGNILATDATIEKNDEWEGSIAKTNFVDTGTIPTVFLQVVAAQKNPQSHNAVLDNHIGWMYDI